jgi:hypothetical protein
MLKNYSDHTISFKIGNVYVEIPAGWSTDLFNDDPELEEFLRKRYPELNEDYGKTEETEAEEEKPKRSRKKTE